MNIIKYHVFKDGSLVVYYKADLKHHIVHHKLDLRLSKREFWSSKYALQYFNEFTGYEEKLRRHYAT